MPPPAIATTIADVQNTQRRHTNRFTELTEDVGALDGRMSGSTPSRARSPRCWTS
ncbi:hypothetical protein [Janibacter sp. Soil728]|uniref:hypothetical protein n=1 Tax=Janibacter sp. Soil728 TaxID=1736393 RepID=UPI000A63D45B|nr:hypothetical protein [Janibacter sp. Soil728]